MLIISFNENPEQVEHAETDQKVSVVHIDAENTHNGRHQGQGHQIPVKPVAVVPVTKHQVPAVTGELQQAQIPGAGYSTSSRNFTLSPETTDCDSADLESEVSVGEGSFQSSGPRMHTAMPILEDGLSSGHASDLEEDVIYSR